MASTVCADAVRAHAAGFTIGGGAGHTPDSVSWATACGRPGAPSWRARPGLRARGPPGPADQCHVPERNPMTRQSVPAPGGQVIRLDGVPRTCRAGAPPALADVSMAVAAGEVVAVTGPSGSGKSTLLNLIAGLDRPTAGIVTVAGRRIDNLSEGALARFRARHVGIIFQFFNLLDDLTVEDNVLLPAQLAGASRRQARARARELLERMGIREHGNAYPARLSGGQRQRVAIARALVNSAELPATRSLAGVTATAGPFAEAAVQTQFGGQIWGQLVLAGRASPGGPVDDVVLNAGHWPDGPGQVVLDGNPGQGTGGPQLGSTLTVTGVPGAPALTVTGFANSITNTADGWVSPAEIARLRGPGAAASTQMLYRFSDAATDAQVRADAAEVTRALPPDAVTGFGSWLAAENADAGNAAIMEPFVVAFALIGLAMAVLIVGNAVSGAVVAGYHRIGVLKSVGLSPAQVVVAYLSRVGWPALAGCVAGVVAGNLLAVPVLHQSARAYGVGSQQVPWWASVAAPAAMLALTALAALAPALRAGRLSAAEAIAAGRAPRAGRGYTAHRVAAGLRPPRPVGPGLAAPLARPARPGETPAAGAFGAP